MVDDEISLGDVVDRLEAMEERLDALVVAKTKNGRVVIVARPPRYDVKSIFTLLSTFVAACAPIAAAYIIARGGR